MYESNYDSNTSSSYEVPSTSTVNIMVIGVGGGGGNAINRMIDAGITSAKFVSINTDKQALSQSKAPIKMQIGAKRTKGFGAGANPNVGAEAAEESREDIRALLKGVDMLFIAAGMGGGTGTGAAPIVASISRELDILTVAIVTKPFFFEGKVRENNAQQGIERLKQYVDAVLVVPNDKLRSKKATVANSFAEADEVLLNAVSGITDLIVKPAYINLDFADVRTILSNSGQAHLGIGENQLDSEGNGSGALKALQKALDSPLLETNISNSNRIIVNIMGGKNMMMTDLDAILHTVNDIARKDANIIMGVAVDQELNDNIRVTLIATGFNGANDRPSAPQMGYGARPMAQPTTPKPVTPTVDPIWDKPVMPSRPQSQPQPAVQEARQSESQQSDASSSFLDKWHDFVNKNKRN